MCIIVVKPKHKELQNKNILERCFTSNKDGAGYMFVDKANENGAGLEYTLDNKELLKSIYRSCF